MRTIDADALIVQMEADAEQMEEPIAKMFAYAAISDIKHAPTIKPQRETGEWIIKVPEDKGLGAVYTCSLCGEEVDCIPSNFCPNCGADMLGKDINAHSKGGENEAD